LLEHKHDIREPDAVAVQQYEQVKQQIRSFFDLLVPVARGRGDYQLDRFLTHFLCQAAISALDKPADVAAVNRTAHAFVNDTFERLEK
jgi:hypothetical protein